MRPTSTLIAATAFATAALIGAASADDTAAPAETIAASCSTMNTLQDIQRCHAAIGTALTNAQNRLPDVIRLDSRRADDEMGKAYANPDCATSLDLDKALQAAIEPFAADLQKPFDPTIKALFANVTENIASCWAGFAAAYAVAGEDMKDVDFETAAQTAAAQASIKDAADDMLAASDDIQAVAKTLRLTP